MVEGPTLLSEALAAGVPVEEVYLDAAGATPRQREVATLAAATGAEVRELQPGVVGRVAGSVHPQALLAVVAGIDVPLSKLDDLHPTFVVVAVAVGDPGNAGSLVRIAAASGAGAVVFCGGSADVYNPKTIRASAGALFHVPVVAEADVGQVLSALRPLGLRTWATAPRDGTAPFHADLTVPLAVLFGNESHGLSGAVATRVDGTLSIPMASSSESVGVAHAAAVICFEAARQRSSPAISPVT